MKNLGKRSLQGRMIDLFHNGEVTICMVSRTWFLFQLALYTELYIKFWYAIFNLPSIIIISLKN